MNARNRMLEWNTIQLVTTLSLTILFYLSSFSCCCVRNLQNSLKVWTYTVQVFIFQGPRHQQHSWFSGYQQQQMFLGTSIEDRAIQTFILSEDYHWLESSGRRYSGCSVDWSVPGTLSEHSTWLPMHNLISIQSTGRTRSSSLVTLARPSFSLGLTYKSPTALCTYASPYLWNQLPSSLRRLHSVHCPPGSPYPAHITLSQSPPSLSSLPRLFTPDFKLISFTNHSHCYSSGLPLRM